MAKISEKKEPGQGSSKFFTTKDLIGMPFEIIEDVNALSDFRETEKKEGKKGQWLCVMVKANGEEKDSHWTNAALRELRNAMPPGIATWKGQRAVINSVSGQGYNTVTKVTRLMGDYAAVSGQQQIGQQPQTPPPQPNPIIDPVALLLEALRPPGIHDSRIMDMIARIEPDPAKAQFLWGMIKYNGKATQKPDGCWVRT